MLRATTFRKIPEQVCDVEVVLSDGTYLTNALVLREVEWFRRRLLDMGAGERRRISLRSFTLSEFELYHKFLQTREMPKSESKLKIIGLFREIMPRMPTERQVRQVRHAVESDLIFEIEL
nr:hypothetical protein K-LCC10_0372 [Kaumoebavirus]